MKLKLTAKDTTVTHDGGQVHSFDNSHGDWGDRQAIAAMMKARLFPRRRDGGEKEGS